MTCNLVTRTFFLKKSICNYDRNENLFYVHQNDLLLELNCFSIPIYLNHAHLLLLMQIHIRRKLYPTFSKKHKKHTPSLPLHQLRRIYLLPRREQSRNNRCPRKSNSNSKGNSQPINITAQNAFKNRALEHGMQV